MDERTNHKPGTHTHIFLQEAKASLDTIPSELLNLNPTFEFFFSSILAFNSEFIESRLQHRCRRKGFGSNV